MAKNDFAWDSEERVGIVQESDKVKYEILQCKLNGVNYIAAEKWVLKKDGWARAKNQVFKSDTFSSIAHIIANVHLYKGDE
jgi:hypothetical protein